MSALGTLSFENNFVYRAITSANAETLNAGLGISAKNPEGSWNIEQHLIHGSNPRSFLNDPWIATTPNINVAKASDNGNGIIKINLSRMLSTSAQKGWLSLPRSSAGYHYSIWQQEVSIFQHVPQNAITIIK